MKFILVIGFLCLNSVAIAQGNLQFNQVVSLSGSIGLNSVCSNVLELYTVPLGKVVKIEYFEVVTSGCQYHYLSINDIEVSKGAFPTWLKAGDVVRVHRTHGSCFGCATTSFSLSGRHHFSAIEFNIVP